MYIITEDLSRGNNMEIIIRGIWAWDQVKDPKNVVADALSRLQKQGDIVDDFDAELPFVPVNKNIFPVHLKEIYAKQAKDGDLRYNVKTNPSHF